MDELLQRRELAAFLRSRLETTDPKELGLTPGSARRTLGLRREEVAGLAGVSLTWYTWLEQARSISVSRKFIDSIARVLRFSQSELAHVYALAGLRSPAAESLEPSSPTPGQGMVQLLSILDPSPSAVTNPWWDLIEYNESFDRLLGGLSSLPAPNKNLLHLAFTRLRHDLFDDWEEVVSNLVGQLRTNLAEHPHDPRGRRVVDGLSHVSEDFARMWAEHSIRRFEPSTVVWHHAEAGDLDLNLVKLAAAGEPWPDRCRLSPGLSGSRESVGRLEQEAPSVTPVDADGAATISGRR